MEGGFIYRLDGGINRLEGGFIYWLDGGINRLEGGFIYWLDWEIKELARGMDIQAGGWDGYTNSIGIYRLKGKDMQCGGIHRLEGVDIEFGDRIYRLEGEDMRIHRLEAGYTGWTGEDIQSGGGSI